MELQRFLIKERAAPGEAVRSYEVFDPRTHVQVGVVREEAGSLLKFLRIFLSRTFLPTKLEARESEDESLVFTVHRAAGWWRRRIEVYDADDHLMGFGENRSYSGRGGFWVFDRRGLPFVEAKAGFRGQGCCFVGPDGRELGAVTREWTGPGKESRVRANQYLVSMGDELAEQPLAKMLLLGAALALDIVDHGQG